MNVKLKHANFVYSNNMTQLAEDLKMALMRVRRAAQLTLPAEVRRALNIKDGDFLEAHITKDGVLLTPVAIVDRARALTGIEEVASRVRDRSADPSENVTAEEERIGREVVKARRSNKHG